MNQIADALETQKHETKEGKRIEKEEAIVDEVKPLLHKLNPFNDFKTTTEQVEKIFKIMYKSSNLTNKLSRMRKMRTSVDIIGMAYHSVASKQDYIANLKNLLEQE